METDPLHLENEEREVYLLKVPARLGNAWKNVTESDVILGEIQLDEKNSNQNGILTINPEHTPSNITLPENYRVDLKPCDLNLKIFSQDGSGRLMMEGKVKDSGIVMPNRGMAYSKLCRQRLLQCMVKDRYVKPLEDIPKQSQKKTPVTIDKPVVIEDKNSSNTNNILSSTAASAIGIPESTKKMKMNKTKLKNLIFHFYEKKEFWSLRELNSYLNQPENHLKEILKELCVYHRKGTTKNTYELKEEYKGTKAGDNEDMMDNEGHDDDQDE